MLKITIPGRSDLRIQNAVFDFNGTVAKDGRLAENLIELLAQIKKDVSVYILTADTYRTVRVECEGLDIPIETIGAGIEKKEFVRELGASHTVCIGNGINDVGMFEISALSIAVIGEEGCATKAAVAADILVRRIEDAFALLLRPARITATLRQ